MQSITRTVGRFTTKRTDDSGDVMLILQEFKAADELLDRLMDAVGAFQKAWKSVLAFQMGIAREFEAIYSQKDEPETNLTADDAAAIQRANGWYETYAELEKDLAQETEWIQTKLLDPAADAKQSIAPLKKVIKKRENFKLDYERYQNRVDSVKQKSQKTGKEDPALVKHESDASSAFEKYQDVDAQIRRSIPSVIRAVQSLLPLLLTEQVMLQHTLVAQFYTVLHGYCQQYSFPSPAPGPDHIVATWDSQFSQLRQEAETNLRMLSTGKAVRQPMGGTEKAKTTTGLSIRSRLSASRTPSQQSVPQIRRSSSNALADEDDGELQPPRPPRNGSASHSPSPRPRIGSVVSTQSIHSHQAVPEYEETPPSKPPRPSLGAAGLGAMHEQRRASSTNTSGLASPAYLGTPLSSSPIGFEQRRNSASTVASANDSIHSRAGDYFAQGRTTSATSIASSIASKKKPPPPPPAKRMVVTALYDFGGQGDGDLVFREGDRIIVVKRTDSTDDWWVGKLGAVQGNFPANYVQLP